MMIRVTLSFQTLSDTMGNDGATMELFRCGLERRLFGQLGQAAEVTISHDVSEHTFTVDGQTNSGACRSEMANLVSDWSWLALNHKVAQSLVRDAREWGGESRELIAPLDGDNFTAVNYCKIEYINMGINPRFRVVTIPTRAGLTVGIGTEILHECPLGEQMIDWLTPRIYHLQNRK